MTADSEPALDARQALIVVLDQMFLWPLNEEEADSIETAADKLIAHLWARGYKIAPLEPG